MGVRNAIKKVLSTGKNVIKKSVKKADSVVKKAIKKSMFLDENLSEKDKAMRDYLNYKSYMRSLNKK